MMARIVACTVGMLLGDAWAMVPALRDLCRGNEVELVCGTYAQPVWEWSSIHVIGCDWQIIRTISDPDEAGNPFCPGKGFHAMQSALEFVSGEFPGSYVIGPSDIGSAYSYTPRDVGTQLRESRPRRFTTVVHPFTRHEWKNCNMVTALVRYRNPVTAVGLPYETDLPRGWAREINFWNICERIIEARGFVGVLSAWTNFAALMGKPQIVASFTADVPLGFNSNAVVMVNPGMRDLQAEVDRMGL